MAKMNMIAALNSALDHQLERDPNVVIFGEDVGYFGGVFRVTAGLQKKYGEHRVFDSPLAEGGIAAIAMGMGLNGLRPVAEIQFADYIFPAYDQIVNEIAKLRHRSGGEFSTPVTIRTPAGGGIKGGHHHSQSPNLNLRTLQGSKSCIAQIQEMQRVCSQVQSNATTRSFSLSQRDATEGRSTATLTMFQRGTTTQMVKFQRNISPSLLSKLKWSEKARHAR